MRVEELYRHNYSQAMRDALGSYRGPYSLAVDRGANDEAILTLNLPATQQGHFTMGQTAIKVADTYVPVNLRFTYVPMDLL